MPKFEGARKRDIKAELAAELSELEKKDKVRKVPDVIAETKPDLETLSIEVEKKKKLRPILRAIPSPALEAQRKEETAEREEKARGIREALHVEPEKTEEGKKKHAERVAAATKAAMEAFARAKQHREDMGEAPKVLGKTAEETFERAKTKREDIERVKSVVGQEKAARLWDEVMPMLWERKGGAAKEDVDAQNLAAKRATDYVVRYADIESKFREDMTSKDAKAAIMSLNADFAKYGLLKSYDPVIGAGKSRSVGPGREIAPGAIGSPTGFPEREVGEIRAQRQKRYETVYEATPEASKRLREEPLLPLTREPAKAPDEGFRKQGEERNELLKRDEVLHAQVAELMRKKRTPAIQNRLTRLSEEIKRTEDRLHEFAKTYGKVALPKTPVMARIAGFFRELFYSGAPKAETGGPKIETKEELTGMDISKETMQSVPDAAETGGPKIETKEELTGMDISKETMQTVPDAQDLYLIALHGSAGVERSANNFVEEAAKYLRAAKGGIGPYMKPFEQLVKDLDVADEPAVKNVLAEAQKAFRSKIAQGEASRETAKARSRTRQMTPSELEEKTPAKAREALSRKK